MPRSVRVERPVTEPAAPIVIVNPAAARLRSSEERARIVDEVVRGVVARTGVRPTVLSGGIDRVGDRLDETTPSFVVAVGGDGTVRTVAAALVGRPVPLAIVPGGTGNVLAGALRVRGIGRSLDAIRHGGTRSIDVGLVSWGSPGDPARAGEGIFLVACGIGADARIMEAAEHEWKRRMRFGAYVGAALRELTRLTVADLDVVADGDRSSRPGYTAMVANCGDIIPGRVGPRQRIDPHDGMLDLIVLGGSDPIAGARGAVEVLVRKGPLDGAAVRRLVRTVRIEATPPQPIQVDGDVLPPGWLEVEVRPASLQVVVPAP